MTSPPDDSTPIVRSLFWRSMTPGDFFNIERAATAAPQGGGGQLYIDIPLGGSVSFRDFGIFISNVPLAEDESKWETVKIQAASVSDPAIVAPVELTPRRGGNHRYRIANQNRQATGGHRHPAWSAERGFPQAPDNVKSSRDTRMPNLEFLKICLARTDHHTFLAGYTNSSVMPASWPREIGLEVLFERYSSSKPDGIIKFSADLRLSPIRLGEWIPPEPEAVVTEAQELLAPARVVRRSKSTTHTRTGGVTGIPDSGQPRPDAREATSVRTPRADEAEDLIENRLRETYRNRSVKRIGHTNLETLTLDDGLLPGADLIILDPENQPERYAEVKSAIGSFPASIRLTLAELQRAKRCAVDGLPYDVWIVVFGEGLVTSILLPNFENEAVILTIDDLVGIEIQISI